LPFFDFAHAQPREHMWKNTRPAYGDYWKSEKWGWYGAKRPVKTPAHAREILEKFFSGNNNVKIGRIKEKSCFFEAEVIDRRGIIVDVVIVDKRTGRIRSLY